MFSFKRNPTPSSSPSKRPTLLPPRPSFAHSESRAGSPTGSHRDSFSSSGARSPLASPALSLSNRDRDGYFNLPLPPTFPGEPVREWSEEEQQALRLSVVEDIKRADDILRLLKVQKELSSQLAGVQKELGGALRKLGGGEGLPAAVPLALTPCSTTSSELSAVLQKSMKTSSKELDRMETVLYKHSKAVKREYNALDEVILINDKRMAAAEKPLQNDSSSSSRSGQAKGGIGMAHERYLRVISGLCDDSAQKKRSTAESIASQHVLAISRLSASICQSYQNLFDATAESMRVGASKVGEIRYAGILVGENWNDDVPGQGGQEEVEAGEETVRWRRSEGQNGAGQGGLVGQKGDGQRNVSDRPRPQGKRSMPVPPSYTNPSRTTSYPSTIATTSQLSSTTSASLSPLTPTDQDRSPVDFAARSHSILSPTTQTSFGVLRQTGPGQGPSRDEPVRDERKGHRPTSSVSDRMKQFENGTIGSHASQASSASSNRSGMSRPPNTRPYSLPAVAPLRLPAREPPPPTTDYRSKEREVPRDYSRLPVPAAASPTVSSGKMSSDGGGEKVRRLSGLFERKNDASGSNGIHVQRVSPSPHSRHGTGCMCPNCHVVNTAKASTIRPVMPHSPSLRPGLPASRQSTSSIHSFSDVEVRQPSPKRLSQKIDRELAALMSVEAARGG
ncbi:hypothetical protein HD553DRAFT_357216 [Filobasidium floriforme]|uniref:uncharacterized protein n=1 Tax=Filobasidium floriforme TaxID=5210 RepID=UPI001E8DA48E|nr:uncharacterized protein HD553DRAFT_357216 [Filobasidium floriforme]KAH8083081.1 hypothetical protein HD553DRAFT_357216 [Filobasidium floriforme]